MGRAFEYRKDRKFKRWNAMSQAFTKIGREIAMAVKSGGPEPSANTRLRMAIQNAKDAQMPKDKVEAAIKRAVSREEKDFEEITYEGYGPHGVAVMVECATENNNRTVANLRTIFNKNGGALGTNGSVAFMFERKGIFVLASKEGQDLDSIELDLIDAGADDIHIDEEEIIASCSFEDFGGMQKSLEDKNFTIKSSVLQRIPTNYKEITEAEEEALNKLLEKLDEDDDVQNVFTNGQVINS